MKRGATIGRIKLSSGNRLNIPKHVVEIMQWKPGDWLWYEIRGSELVLRKFISKDEIEKFCTRLGKVIKDRKEYVEVYNKHCIRCSYHPCNVVMIFQEEEKNV